MSFVVDAAAVVPCNFSLREKAILLVLCVVPNCWLCNALLLDTKLHFYLTHLFAITEEASPPTYYTTFFDKEYLHRK
jgi:hypothetical protein